MAMEHSSIKGRFLVKRRQPETQAYYPLLVSDTSLSFWGGIDPQTGVIIDTTHPLHGQNVRDTIFCIPSGRGSCTASQVLLELILNDIAPRAIVLRDVDGLAAVGALIADEIFEKASMDIIHVGVEQYELLLSLDNETERSLYGSLDRSGTLSVSPNFQDVELKIDHDDMYVYTKSDILTNNQLSQQERDFLANATSKAQEMAFRVTFRYARIIYEDFDTEESSKMSSNAKNTTDMQYIAVDQAHIDACTYIGPGGLAFAQNLVKAGGKFVIPTSLNAMSCDRTQWQQLGVPAPYAHNALAMATAYTQLGGNTESFTCAPYLLHNHKIPQKGQHVVWGESNAVVYANSVLGARTNKVADYLDVCGALTGIVPYSGAHIDENRKPGVCISISALMDDINNLDNVDLDVLFPLLGHVCGSVSDGRVPLVVGLEHLDLNADDTSNDAGNVNNNDYHLKAFCAAFGTTGTSPLVHVAGLTAEAKDKHVVEQWATSLLSSGQHESISLSHLQETYRVLNGEKLAGDDKNDDTHTNDSTTASAVDYPVDLVALGNPHLSVRECKRLVDIIAKLDSTTDDSATPIAGSIRKNDNVRVIACISRDVYKEASQHIPYLQQFGFEFIHDTCWCMLLDPPVIPESPDARILTNSAKYAHYGPGLTNKPNFRFSSTVECMRAARLGYIPRTGTDNGKLPIWLRKTLYHTSSRQRYAPFVKVMTWMAKSVR